MTLSMIRQKDDDFDLLLLMGDDAVARCLMMASLREGGLPRKPMRR